MKYIIQSIIVLCMVSSTGQLNAQTPEKKYTYTNAVGIRAGGTAGPTFKHMMNQTHAMEFILGIWPNGIGITGLYEKYAATGAAGLNLYYGAGAHFTFETNHYIYRRWDARRGDAYIYRYGQNGFGIGIDGVVGIEYKIPPIPIALSFDLKPFIEFSNYGNIYTAIDPSLGIKITF